MAYDSFLRAFRLLLRGPAPAGGAPVAMPLPVEAVGEPSWEKNDGFQRI